MLSQSRAARPRPVSRARRRATGEALRRFGAETLGLMVARTAARHSRLADLALSFPGLLAVLARGERGPAATRAGEALVVAGAPLRVIATALGVPMWLRKLPPEAFAEPLPRSLPNGPDIARRIASLVPPEAAATQLWLQWVGAAFAACDAGFALWAAREFLGLAPCRRGPACHIPALAVYAWYSARPGLAATAAMPRRWSPQMSLPDAADEVRAWCNRLAFEVLPLVPPALPEFRSAVIEGLLFERLETPASFIAAGAVLRNCLSGYAGHGTYGREVWVVRDGDALVAALEIEVGGSRGGLPLLVQLTAERNTRAEPRVIAAAYRFLQAWPDTAPRQLAADGPKPDTAAWRRLWLPYWRAKGRLGILPFLPDASPFWNMTAALDDLQQAGRHRRRRRPAA